MSAERLTDPLRAGQELFDVFPEDSAPYLYLKWSRNAYGSPHIYHLASILVCIAHELDSRGFYLVRGMDGGRIPLTLWFLLLGGSASGKSTIMEAAQDFWRAAWKRASVHRGDPWVEPEGSPQGLIIALQELYDAQENHTSGILFHTEAAKVFNTREAIAETLCKVYDGRTFQLNYRYNQKRQKGGRLHAEGLKNPHLSLIMASTEEQLAPYFRDQHRQGGIFTRFCWINPTFRRDDIQIAADFAGANRLQHEYEAAMAATVKWFAQLSLLRKVRRENAGFSITPKAHSILEAKLFQPFKDAYVEGDTDNMHGVRMRLVEKAKVLAAIFAAIRGTTRVGNEDVENAITLARVFLAHTQSIHSFGSDEVHRHAAKLEHLIKNAGNKGLSRRELYRFVRINKRMMDQVVETLLDRGFVFEAFDQHNTGRFVHMTSKAGQKILDKRQERRAMREKGRLN